MKANEVEQEIIRLYYEEHKRPSEIAPIICKTPQYVSKIATKDISDIDFAKWNRSIFGYAKKSSHLVLKKGLKVTSDVPRVVRNIVHPSSIKSSNVFSN